jgi:hypothetical protein
MGFRTKAGKILARQPIQWYGYGGVKSTFLIIRWIKIREIYTIPQENLDKVIVGICFPILSM